MENKSNKTHLCSVIWNFVTRSQDGSTETCNECKKNEQNTQWLRTKPCGNGLTIHVSNIRTHLTNVHKINLKEVEYDDTDPTGNNKRIGFNHNKIPCHFCGMHFDTAAGHLKDHLRYFLYFVPIDLCNNSFL
jgi:hypothetical protein